METYWVCPPDSLAADETANAAANLEPSGESGSPKGRASPLGRRIEEPCKEALAVATTGRNPRSSSRASRGSRGSRNLSPPDTSPSREASHHPATLAGGSEVSMKDFSAGSGCSPQQGTAGPLGSLATFRRQAMLLVGGPSIPAAANSPPAQPKGHSASSPPLYSRRSLPPSLPAAVAGVPPLEDEASALVPAPDAPPAATSSSPPSPVKRNSTEGVAGSVRVGGVTAEDWC
jgi:hypothetical protein